MSRSFAVIVTAAVAFGSAAPARAQVYPERIREVARHLTENYQRRDRGRDDRAQAVDRFTKTVHLGSDGSLDVSNIAGTIIVSRGSGGDATIDVVRTARGRDDADAKEQLSLVRVDVNERNGRAEVKERYPERGSSDRHNWNVTTDFTISAPAGTRLTIKSISGDIKVTDITGDVAVETVSGDVRLASVGRVTTAKSISGNVEVQDTKIDGGLEAGSVSGDVVLRKISARRLTAGSVSGNVRVEDVDCERVDAHTTSGNASFAGQLARNGRYDIKSFSGEVRVAVAGNVGFEVEATSFSGDVRSDLPLTIRGGSDERRGRRRSLNGTFGDGSAVLNLSTFSGSVVISKR